MDQGLIQIWNQESVMLGRALRAHFYFISKFRIQNSEFPKPFTAHTDSAQQNTFTIENFVMLGTKFSVC